jgi:predicted MFS family arabinose efflux permease
VTEPLRNLFLAGENVAVFHSLLGISWMWFFGALFLRQSPPFARDVLGGNEQVASLLLVVFSIGIAFGALLCEGLSRRHVEIGPVPLGAIGMSLFAVELCFASSSITHPQAAPTFVQFVATPANWRVLADLGLLALFAGLYSVPM